ncbi:hypothetical protein [Paenibacillus wynnii]|uniref:hypothetical protein n=1 Tax=Paenibacillus wynnii TaxID=268407 RepID=UPI00068EFCA8|nr:hypothetical protein [Paenibacillus wynnii]
MAYKLCAKCGTKNNGSDMYCINCNASIKDAIPYEKEETIDYFKEHLERKKGQKSELNDADKFKQTKEGFVFGVGCLIFGIPVGIVLSLTGIGALLGIPLILASIGMPIYGALHMRNSKKLICPSCSHSISIIGNETGVTCPTCKKRLVSQGERYIVID